MKIVEVSNDNESLDVINNSDKKEILNQFFGYNNIDSNTIHSCILGIEDNKIKNYALYTGTKDTRLVQMSVENLSSKRFLEQAIDYAYKSLNAYTITIFTDKQSKQLEEEGFENLGSDNNMITYIKEREIEKEVGRVRI